MKVRRLEDWAGSRKPDRSNASWNKKNSDEEGRRAGIPAPDDSRELSASEIKPPEKIAFTATKVIPENMNAPRRVRRSSHKKRVPPLARAIFFLFPLALLAWLFLRSPADEITGGTSRSGEEKRDSSRKTKVAQRSTGTGPLSFPTKIAKAFISTTDPEERLKYCREPERIAKIMADFPEQARSEIPVGSRLGTQLVVEDKSIPYIQYSKTLFENGDTRALYVVSTDDGPKVDWEAYARHSGALVKWVEEARNPQIERGEESAEVRILVSIENYYNYRFSDDQTWMSYRISSPDLSETVTAYAKKDSVAAKILDEELGFEEKRMTLQLRSRIEDARNKQYEIERVLSVAWVKPEGDFESLWLSSEKSK